MGKNAQRKRGGVSGVDPTQMRAPAGQQAVGQPESREQRMMKLLGLRRMARDMEGKTLYFLPVETNPLAVMGVLQTSDPKAGIDMKKSVPWSVLDSFLPLPLMEVEGRVGMYYTVDVTERNDDAVSIRFVRQDIIEEPVVQETDPEGEDDQEKAEDPNA